MPSDDLEGDGSAFDGDLEYAALQGGPYGAAAAVARPGSARALRWAMRGGLWGVGYVRWAMRGGQCEVGYGDWAV